MTRKIIIGVSTVIFLVALVYSYFNFRQIKTPVTNALHAIPKNAAVIVKINNAQELIDKINDGNIIWDELIGTEFFRAADKDLDFIDSLVKSNASVREIFDAQKSYLSFHKLGAEKLTFLFSVTMPPTMDSKDIHKIIAKNAAGSPTSSRNFKGTALFQIQGQGRSLTYTIFNGIFILSPSSLLLEEAISQLISESSIEKDAAFKTIYATAGEKVKANVFVNYKYFFPAFSNFFSDSPAKKMKSLADFANWGALDLHLKPNAVMLNGFSHSHDSSNYLNLFAKQKAQDIELTRILPASTASFIFFGFSNFSSFYKDYSKYRERTEPENKQKIDEFYKTFGVEAESKLSSWIGNEVAVVVNGLGNNITDKTFAVFKASNIENALDQLSAFDQSENVSTEIYKDFEIKSLLVANAFELFLGTAFSNLKTPYYTHIGKYIIVANSPESLKTFINEVLAERTLQKDNYYNTFSENISTGANIYIYSNIARSSGIYKNYLQGKYAEVLTTHSDLFRKFEAVAFQINSDNDFFYNNFYVKYNPVYKQQPISLWETQLDAKISSQPKLVINHLNNSREIFVQDDDNNIYLISNTGKILWKKPLNEKIISDIYQIDLYKNNKFQMLFNTGSKLYLIDRNGNDVEKYPVLLKHPATTALTLIDYDKNHNYRIIIPLKDNQIYNYGGEGELVKGYIPFETELPVKIPVQYTTVDGKDFLIAIDSGGKVYILDRKGKSLIKLKEKFHISPSHNNFYIETGKDLSKTYLVSTDSTGTVIKLNLVDELENINVSEFDPGHTFEFKDLTGDKIKEFIFINNKTLAVFNQNKEKIFEYEFPHPVNSCPQYFYFPDGTGKTGVTDKFAEEIYLFDESGNLFETFPLKGSTLFSIGNVNQDDKLNLVVGSGKNIYLYEIKH